MAKRKPMLFKELDNGCIVCTSHKLDRRGYLLIRDPRYADRKGEEPRIFYHRYVWELNYGKIPEGYEVHHLCHNRACCNINHLQCLAKSEHSRVHITETLDKRYSKNFVRIKHEAKEYWLQHYGISCCKLAGIFDVNPKTAWQWIHKWKSEDAINE